MWIHFLVVGKAHIVLKVCKLQEAWNLMQQVFWFGSLIFFKDVDNH